MEETNTSEKQLNFLEEIIEHSLFLLRATVGVFLRKIDGEDFEDMKDEND